jgi:hypothetical protein
MRVAVTSSLLLGEKGRRRKSLSCGLILRYFLFINRLPDRIHFFLDGLTIPLKEEALRPY